MQDILDMSEDNTDNEEVRNTMACVTFTIFYKMGKSLCFSYDLTQSAVYFTAQARENGNLSDSELEGYAQTAADLRTANFRPKEVCDQSR